MKKAVVFILLITLQSIYCQNINFDYYQMAIDKFFVDNISPDSDSRSINEDASMNSYLIKRIRDTSLRLLFLDSSSKEYDILKKSNNAMILGNKFWKMNLSEKYRVKVKCDGMVFDYVEYGFHEEIDPKTALKSFNIFFEGTSDNIYDWLANIYSERIPYLTPSGIIYVHAGLYSYFEAIKDKVSNKILERSKGEETVIIVLAGYSQGAAIAHLLNSHLKSISGKDSFPKIDIRTTTYGGPGAVFNDSRGDIVALENYLKSTRNVIQMHAGYDFVPYAFTKEQPPEGYTYYIGSPHRIDRIPVGVSEFTSTTPLIQERQSVIEEEYTSNPEALKQYNYLMEKQVTPQFFLCLLGKLDEIDHVEYYRLFDGNPLSRVKSNFIDEESISFRSLYTINSSSIDKNISTLGAISLEKNSNITLTASKKVTLKSGFTASSGSNFRIVIER